jgi:aminopeptidase
MDERTKKLAYNLVNYSCRIQKGEKVLISTGGFEAVDLVKAIIKEVYRVGGLPFFEINHNSVQREFLMSVSAEQLELIADVDAKKMEQMDAYIGIGAQPNSSELADVPPEKISLYERIYSNKVHSDIRLKKKWVVLRYPSYSMAQSAGTSLEAFEDFYYNVCNLDYSKMSKAMDNLVDIMNKTDKVRLVGKGTDITFSIKDIPAIKCDGLMNIPDGEVYTAPVKESVNGTISYNTPTEYMGSSFENVVLEFKNGKIIRAESNNTKKLNEILDTDEGARYIGEFAIGVNPFITKAMKNILFDEKIRGSIHFTPGNAYDDADNGNRSAVHWDLVMIQTQEYGGGEIYFDDKLIRKDGIFVIPELECLNPENLR